MSDEETTESTETTSDADAVAAAVTDDRPDWLLDRYMTEGRSIADATSEQAKGYNEIRGKLGSFTGAPDAYEFVLNDQLKENGVELEADNPLITSFTEMAKEAGMSQDMANNLVNLFVEGQYADSGANEEAEVARVGEEMKLLGDDAQQRVDNISKWASVHLTPEQVEGLGDATTTAAGVKAVEALISKSRNASMTNTDVEQVSSITQSELDELMQARDGNNNLKRQVDPEYRKMVSEKFAILYPGENVHTVG